MNWIDTLKVEGARDRIRKEVEANSWSIGDEADKIAWANPEESRKAIEAIMARTEELKELFKALATYEVS